MLNITFKLCFSRQLDGKIFSGRSAQALGHLERRTRITVVIIGLANCNYTRGVTHAAVRRLLADQFQNKYEVRSCKQRHLNNGRDCMLSARVCTLCLSITFLNVVSLCWG